MENPFLFLPLFAALSCAHAPAAPSSILPEPGPFGIIPKSASESVMFYGRCDLMFATGSEWKGSTLYVESWPVEFERSRVSLARPYSFPTEAFTQHIHFLYIRPTTDEKLPLPQRANGTSNFNVGYQF